MEEQLRKDKDIEKITGEPVLIKEDLTLVPTERPGTAEQLKQFYNGEEWKATVEAFKKAYETIIETVTPIINRVAKVAKQISRELIKVYSIDPEIKKCYGIYRRTKKARIRKKQITRITKKIERYRKYGNMDKDAG